MTDSRQPVSNEDGLPDAARDHEVYTDIVRQEDFVELRKRYGAFVFPATAAFMTWYILYVICNNWARDFMNTPVIGNINVALIFGLLQFASTFTIAALYARYSTKSLDPLAGKLHDEFDARTGR